MYAHDCADNHHWLMDAALSNMEVLVACLEAFSKQEPEQIMGSKQLLTTPP